MRKLKTQAKGNGLPQSSGGGLGLEMFQPKDLIIPRLILVQTTSHIKGATAGNFLITVTGEEFEAIEVVFLKGTLGRVFFDKKSEDTKPTCGSADRIMPSPRFKPPVSPTCGECALAQWKGEDPPLCNESINLLGIIADTRFPFWWAVKSTALHPTREFVSGIIHSGKDIFDAKVTIFSDLVTKPGKKYYVPRYKLSWLEDSSPYRALYDAYAGEDVEETFEAEETVH